MDSEKIEEFFREFYEKEILAAAKLGKKSITVDFDAFDSHCRLIAEKLLNDPETMLPDIEKAASDAIVLPEVEGIASFHVRFKNLPEHQMIRIRSLRSEHIGKFVCVDGIVKRAGEVKPKIDVAEFECECGNKMSVKQTEELLRYPSGCDMCGNKRGFKMIDKKLFDARWVVIEEPFEMTSGEKPGQVSVYLKEDLTAPELQRKCDPGNRIKVTGIIKEMTLKTKGGARKVQSDIFVEANHVEPAEIEWDEVDISNKDVEAIKALAADPNVYKRIVASIAPSIYGLEEVKEAILLQMMGGVQQKLLDGTRVRGDIHILLLGDPAVAKCVDGDTEVLLSNGQLMKIRDIADEELKKKSNPIDDGCYAVMNHDILSMNSNGKLDNKIANIIWKRSAPEYMYNVKTQTGREITVTPTHPFFICNGIIASKKADEIKTEDFIAVPRTLKINPSDKLDIKIERSKARNASHINIPQRITPELSRILGYAIGDGRVQRTKTGFCIWLTNNNKNLIQDFRKSVKKIFGLDSAVRKPHKGKEAVDVYVSSIELGRFMEVLDKNILNKSCGKRVPQAIMCSSDENVKDFIKAFFDCEAAFSSMQTQINCTSASKHILKDVQLLLLRFGIISQIGHTVSGCNGWKKKYFRLKITGSESVKNFIDNIGFREKSAKFSFKKLHSNIDVIPSVSRLLKSVRTRNGLSQFDMGIPRTTYQHYERGDRNPSRRDLRKIAENLKQYIKSDEELIILDFLANSDIIWDKIIEKKKIKSKEKWVYDLQVDGTHNFVANGIFVHNSQLLKMVSQLIPRGRYVSGKGATGAGLTATVFRDEELMGGWVLEAGAMVLCHKGVICLHPDTKVIANNQIVSLKNLFDEAVAKKGIAGSEIIEFNDFCLPVVSFDKNSMATEAADAARIGRKMYKGKLLKIKTESGFETILTPNHMLLDGNSLKWKSAKDFSARDFIISPLKLPENKNETLIFDLIPDSWKVSLSREEKSELKKRILEKYKTLADFNKKFGLNAHIISGNRQMAMSIFRKALLCLGIYDKWKTKRMKFIRKHDGERLKVSSITPELGYILGFILGDGYVKSTQRRSEIAIVQSKNHKKYIERLLSSWGSVFEKEMRLYNVLSETKIRGRDVKSDSVCLKSGNNILSLIYEKIVGNNLENILLLNDTVLKAFIAGAMDSDGCLSVKKGLKKGKIYETVNMNFLLTNSKEASKNFMLALRRFDCYSKLIEGKAVHNILITGRKDIFALKNAISCFSEKMKKSIPLTKNKVSSASDNLPSFPVSEICKNISKINKSLLLSKGVWSNIYNFANFRQQPSRDQLQKIIERLPIDRNIEEEALNLLKRDYFLDRIESIKDVEYEGFVYDLLVPETGNFVADGFFVHNCIDEFDKMGRDDQIAMHEALEQQSYHPNTEITLSDGSKCKIGMFVDGLMERNKTKIIKGKDCEILPTNDISILTTDFSKIYPAKINRVSRHIAPERFINITFSNGRSILVTPEHPVFVLDGTEIKTVPAESAKKDMFAPIPKNLPFASVDEKLKRIEKNHFNEKEIMQPEKMTTELARVLGYYVSEGHSFVGERCKEIGFTNSDAFILDDMKSSMSDAFGMQPYSYERHPNIFINRYSSTQLHRFFEQNFPEVLEKARSKKAPDLILKCTNDIVKPFLSAAYLGDGFVDSERFGLSTTSLDLAKGYQELLLKLRIYSYIAEDMKQKAFKVVISGTESMKLFLENIVDAHDYRRDRINAFISRSAGKNRQRGDFPYDFGFEIKEILSLLKIDDGYFQPSQKNGVTEQTIRKYIGIIGEKTSCMRKAIESERNMVKLRDSCKISQQDIENKYGVNHQTISYIERCKFHKRKNEIMGFIKAISQERIKTAEKTCKMLEKFLDSDISWIRIRHAEAVENKGCKYVYDVTVEPSKSFISECLVLHNTISIAKASIIATLPAQVSVLAGANPKFSRFDVYRPLMEQTDIPDTLLSRFDLKFALRDVPDKENDEKIASHILESRLNPEIRKPEISQEFLRKFIAYMRQNCHPKMTKEALERIKNFYVTMRGMYKGEDTVAITLRQNEALLRMTEASAKVRFSSVAEIQDAERAIKIMKVSLQQFGYDYETGKIDVDRTEGTSSSQRSKIRILMDVIEALEKRIGKQIPKEDVIAEAEDHGLKGVDEMIQKLKSEGMLFEPKHNVIQKL